MTSSGRPPPGTDPVWRAALAIARGEDVETDVPRAELAGLLRRHRLLGHADLVALPDSLRSLLADELRAHRAHAMAQLACLTSLTGAFREAGLRLTPFKGIVFQRTFTGSVFGRSSRDLDLWVDDGRAAKDLLSELGWQGRPSPTRQTSFHRDGLALDVHDHLFAPRHGLDAVDRVLLPRLESDGAIPAVGQALLAHLHAAKDGWSTLRALADIRRAEAWVEGHGHGQVLDDLARRTRTRGLVAEGRRLSREVFVNGRQPSSLRRPEGPGPVQLLRYLRLRESRRDRLDVLAGTLLQPSELDGSGVGRPFRRTIRLLRSYARL